MVAERRKKGRAKFESQFRFFCPVRFFASRHGAREGEGEGEAWEEEEGAEVCAPGQDAVASRGSRVCPHVGPEELQGVVGVEQERAATSDHTEQPMESVQGQWMGLDA